MDRKRWWTLNINERVIQAVSSIVPICVPNFYDGGEAEYVEFEIDSSLDWFWDDAAHCVRHDVTLRWYMPLEQNVIEGKFSLLDLLTDAGFYLNSIDDISDDVTQGYEYDLQYWDPLDSWAEALE